MNHRLALPVLVLGLAVACPSNEVELNAYTQDLDERIAQAKARSGGRAELTKAVDKQREEADRLAATWKPDKSSLVPALTPAGVNVSDAPDGGLVIAGKALAPTLKVLASGAPTARVQRVVVKPTGFELTLRGTPPVPRGSAGLLGDTVPAIPKTLQPTEEQRAMLEAKREALRKAEQAAGEIEALERARDNYDSWRELLTRGIPLGPALPLLQLIAKTQTADVTIGLDGTIKGTLSVAKEKEKAALAEGGLTVTGDGLEGLTVSGRFGPG